MKPFQFLFWYDYNPFEQDDKIKMVNAPSIKQAVTKFIRWAKKRGNISQIDYEVGLPDGTFIDISEFKKYKEF